jgi:putative FmdB family regulatory protein
MTTTAIVLVNSPHAKWKNNHYAFLHLLTRIMPVGYKFSMPLYEYICEHCHKKFSWLIGVVSDPTPPTCDFCGATQAKRREVNRFARVRSEEEALDALSDPDAVGDLDDPHSARRWAKEMGKEMGEDLGDDFEEYLDTAEAGGDDDFGAE